MKYHLVYKRNSANMSPNVQFQNAAVISQSHYKLRSCITKTRVINLEHIANEE